MYLGSVGRMAALAGLCLALTGCGGLSATQLTDVDYGYARAGRTASTDQPPLAFPGDEDSDLDSDPAAPSAIAGTHLQCVPYARAHSNIDIHGDAYTWWDKAAGVYARGDTPIEGSVMVMVNYGGSRRAHVAVVRRVVSAREILIDHANWLNDGAIYVNDPVKDVSPDNDWSQVKVWNIRTGSWGVRVYAVRGFIGPGKEGDGAVVASYRPNSDPLARMIAATVTDRADTGEER